jgi:cytochrome P450
MPDRSLQEVRIGGFFTAREALRHRDLRQGLYDEGAILMENVIVNLHGRAHTARRRLENRLFRRETFHHWEDELIPRSIETSLIAHATDGRVDLLEVARDTMMRIAADIAGIDLGDSPERFVQLRSIMSDLALASTVRHYIGDKAAVAARGEAALNLFDRIFFAEACARRRLIIDDIQQGRAPIEALPRDVLSTLLMNQDNLDLPLHDIRREVAYFPWVGSHSTSTAFVYLMDHVFEWLETRPAQRPNLCGNLARLQQFSFESLRLHPASPFAERVALQDITLPDQTYIPEGSRVIIEMQVANRDPSVFGIDCNEFNPGRSLPPDVPAWGLSFGTGFHACLGQEVAAGTEPDDGTEVHLYGAIATIAQHLLRVGARRVPDEPAERDEASVRRHFRKYPVSLS